MITTIDFLRHGEAAGGSYYRGMTDDPLTELGWQQMQASVAGQKWDHIISSPLQRCRQFAEKLHQHTQIPINIEHNWQEINFGDWEGKKAEQINSEDLAMFYQDPVKNTPKNAENYTAFVSRVERAWYELIASNQGQHILVITHAGVIRSLFNIFLNIPPSKIFNLQIDHAGLTQFKSFDDTSTNFVSLVSHNLVPAKLY